MLRMKLSIFNLWLSCYDAFDSFGKFSPDISDLFDNSTANPANSHHHSASKKYQQNQNQNYNLRGAYIFDNV